MKQVRKIIVIDENKCNGCGQCASACAEGAIQIINGKAKLVSEIYCDGLGACIRDCPVGALTLEEREAPDFDPTAVEKHLGTKQAATTETPCGCPGSHARTFATAATGCPGSASKSLSASEETASSLTNWPIQLMLVPANAPYLKNSRLLLAADCTAFAFPDFHRRFVPGRILLNACPKLDDSTFYLKKLTELIQTVGLNKLGQFL